MILRLMKQIQRLTLVWDFQLSRWVSESEGSALGRFVLGSGAINRSHLRITFQDQSFDSDLPTAPEIDGHRFHTATTHSWIEVRSDRGVRNKI
ncbi:hypothetical protein TNCT_353281 [Trichonephila clavata]|uniref:Uncharacterized protein n=1 Tax=Trichonephila clavata TaxID=2740835 RepID=A0A8X6HE00_TRICU|nr:hypothetical protein TNCT_353281 [Trichonephila clavata]